MAPRNGFLTSSFRYPKNNENGFLQYLALSWSRRVNLTKHILFARRNRQGGKRCSLCSNDETIILTTLLKHARRDNTAIPPCKDCMQKKCHRLTCHGEKINWDFPKFHLSVTIKKKSLPGSWLGPCSSTLLLRRHASLLQSKQTNALSIWAMMSIFFFAKMTMTESNDQPWIDEKAAKDQTKKILQLQTCTQEHSA